MSKIDAKASARQAKALELRISGASYRTIAQTLGYGGPSGAHKSVVAGIKKMLQEPSETCKRLELTRLDKLLAAFWQKAMNGDELAADRVLKVMERRARLLGIDQPVDMNFLVKDLTAKEATKMQDQILVKKGLEPLRYGKDSE